jgi:hypothetical protein
MDATYSKLRAEIDALRASLRQLDSKQINSVVRFHIAVVDAYLSAASQNRIDPMFFDGLALCVSDLLNSIRDPSRGCGSAHCLFCQSALKTS